MRCAYFVHREACRRAGVLITRSAATVFIPVRLCLIELDGGTGGVAGPFFTIAAGTR